MFDFFLSHNRAEKDWTRSLASALREKGAKVFFDEDSISIGQDIVTAIGKALQSSRYVVLVLSTQSIKSRWVELEWASSLHSDPDASERHLLPILKEECETPYLIRRLRHLDARNLNIEACADQLISILDMKSPPEDAISDRRTNINAPIEIHVGGALRFGALQYIERPADLMLERALMRGESVYLYGPRMMGKTSMLIRAITRASLRGTPYVFVDLQAFPTDDSDAFFESLGHRLATGLGVEWEQFKGHPMYKVTSLLRKVAASSDHPALILAFDEVDVLSNRDYGEQFSYMLRALLSDPTTRKISCVCVGMLPPWLWANQGVASPWWNMLHPLRIPPFTLEQIEEFWKLASLQDAGKITELFELIGGHPWLLMKAAREVAEGLPLSQLLENPLKTEGPFLPVGRMTMHSVIYLLPNHPSVLKALVQGESVQSDRDRELLWLAGVIRDADENPPSVSAKLIIELIHRLLNEAT